MARNSFGGGYSGGSYGDSSDSDDIGGGGGGGGGDDDTGGASSSGGGGGGGGGGGDDNDDSDFGLDYGSVTRDRANPTGDDAEGGNDPTESVFDDSDDSFTITGTTDAGGDNTGSATVPGVSDGSGSGSDVNTDAPGYVPEAAQNVPLTGDEPDTNGTQRQVNSEPETTTIDVGSREVEVEQSKVEASNTGYSGNAVIGPDGQLISTGDTQIQQVGPNAPNADDPDTVVGVPSEADVTGAVKAAGGDPDDVSTLVDSPVNSDVLNTEAVAENLQNAVEAQVPNPQPEPEPEPEPAQIIINGSQVRVPGSKISDDSDGGYRGGAVIGDGGRIIKTGRAQVEQVGAFAATAANARTVVGIPTTQEIKRAVQAVGGNPAQVGELTTEPISLNGRSSADVAAKLADSVAQKEQQQQQQQQQQQTQTQTETETETDTSTETDAQQSQQQQSQQQQQERGNENMIPDSAEEYGSVTRDRENPLGDDAEGGNAPTESLPSDFTVTGTTGQTVGSGSVPGVQFPQQRQEVRAGAGAGDEGGIDTTTILLIAVVGIGGLFAASQV